MPLLRKVQRMSTSNDAISGLFPMQPYLRIRTSLSLSGISFRKHFSGILPAILLPYLKLNPHIQVQSCMGTERKLHHTSKYLVLVGRRVMESIQRRSVSLKKAEDVYWISKVDSYLLPLTYRMRHSNPTTEYRVNGAKIHCQAETL